MKLDSHRKKQRGLRRHAKKIGLWKDANLHLNEEHLDMYSFDYVKLTVDPFYRRFSINENEWGFRNPPNWIKRMFFDGMLEIIRSWNTAVKAKYNKYYLKLWIYEKTFIESQVVVAIESRIDWYNTIFDEREFEKEFPYQKFGYNAESLSDVVWKQFHCYERLFHSELVDDIDYLSYIADKACRVEDDEKYGKVYLIDKGVVWVGEVVC